MTMKVKPTHDPAEIELDKNVVWPNKHDKIRHKTL